MAFVEDTVFDPFRDFMIDEMGRRIPIFTASFVGYDGDPNGGGAPALLDNATPGTVYLRSTPPTLYDKLSAGAGNWVERGSGGGGGGGGSVTLEDITIDVDPGGSDPTIPIVINNQAEADSHGAFATIPAAVAALPQSIMHQVSIRLPDGDYILDYEMFGDLTRFHIAVTPDGAFPPNNGQIIFEGLNWITAPTTTTYTVLSTDSSGLVILNADPGFTDDEYSSYYLLGVSGTGAGSYRPIRTHTDEDFYTAGSTAFGAGSVVEVVSPATRLRLPDSISKSISTPESLQPNNVVLSRLEFFPDPSQASTSFGFKQGSVLLQNGCRFNQVRLAMEAGRLAYENCSFIVSGLAAPTGVLVLFDSQLRTFGGSSRPMAIITSTHYGIQIETSGSVPTLAGAYFFGQDSIDGATVTAILVDGAPCQFTLVGYSDSVQFPRVDTNTPYAVTCENGVAFMLFAPSATMALAAASTFRGATADIKLDGVGINWSDIDPDPNNAAIGPLNSMVIEKL